MTRNFVLALAAAAALLGTGAAQAARVDVSVGIAYRGIPPAVYPSAYQGPAYFPPVVYAPRPRIWLPPLPRFAPAPWGWRHDGGREAAWHGGHDRDDHHDRHGIRGPW